MSIKSETAKKLLKYTALSGGVVVLSILAPQLPYQILKSYLKEKDKLDRRKLKRNLDSLKSEGLIEINEKEKSLKIKITKKGKEKTLEYDLSEMKLQKPKKWDKIWRIVIFDIPETKKEARNALRALLKRLDFATIQKSVFVTPYPCKDEIYYIKNIFGVHKYVNLIEAKMLDEENEKNFRERFKLET